MLPERRSTVPELAPAFLGTPMHLSGRTFDQQGRTLTEAWASGDGKLTHNITLTRNPSNGKVQTEQHVYTIAGQTVQDYTTTFVRDANGRVQSTSVIVAVG